MASNESYRVTRGGADIFVGPLDGLIAVAREGGILANDLIYDPEVQKWVFARSLGALAGFPLKGHRTGAPVQRAFSPGKLLNEGVLRRRQQNRRRLMSAFALLLVLTSTSVLVFLVPTTKEVSKSPIDRFVNDGEPRIRIEGSGEGMPDSKNRKTSASNLDGKSVEVEGRPDDTGETDTTGRKAALDGPQGGGTKGSGLGTSAQAEGPADERQQSTMSDKGAEKQVAKGAGRQRAMIDQPQPKGESVAPLPLEAETDDGGMIKIKAPREVRAKRALSMAEAAEEVMKAARAGEKDVSIDELLAARYQARYAVRAYESLDKKHENLPSARALMEELEKAFTVLCTALYDDSFCRIKAKHPGWPDVVVNGVKDGKVMVGMTEAQMRASWGEPMTTESAPQGRTFCYDALCTRRALVIGKTVVEVRK